jgi:hypothetical protein
MRYASTKAFAFLNKTKKGSISARTRFRKLTLDAGGRRPALPAQSGKCAHR